MSLSRNVLIVEDEPLIAMMLEDVLDSLGHKVVAMCDNVEAALTRVEEGGFDLAVLDVHLGGRTSWPVAERLQALGIPFLVATGGSIEAQPAAFANAPTLTKPYTVDAVPRAIEAALATV